MILIRRGFSSTNGGILRLEKKANDETFKELISKSKMPVLVDFYAEWCGPCRMISPILSKLAGKREDVLLVKVDIDKSPRAAMDYQVTALPTIVAFDKGKETGRFIGMKDENSIKSFISKAVSSSTL